MSSTTTKPELLRLEHLSKPQTDLVERLEQGAVLAIAPMGFGKAVCAQTAAQSALDRGKCTRVLVLAPKQVAMQVWAEEYKKWEHLEPVGVAVGTAQHRKAVIRDKRYRIVVMNIEALIWFFAQYTRSKYHDFDGLVIDETSKFKNAGGAWVRGMRTRVRGFKWRIGLSATPVAESGIDIYSQLLLLDDGKTLGRSKMRFLDAYFRATDYHRRNWKYIPGGKEALAAAITPATYVCEDKEADDKLPPLADVFLPVRMPKDTEEATDSMIRDYAVNLYNDVVTASNSAVVVGKLQQLCRGAIIAENNTVEWLHKEKFDALEIWMENHPNTHALISYQFVFELTELQRRFPEIGFAGTPAHIAAWNRGELQYMALHPRSAGHGLNLQDGGHTLINLGPIWSADQWRQLVGRIRRRGQKNTVTRVTFVAEFESAPNVELRILERLDNKKLTEQDFMQRLLTPYINDKLKDSK